jgi:hypothetical protein
MGILLMAPIASAGPSLWLYPKDAGPREGGHVVPPGTPFTLVIENRGKESASDNAQAVELVVAVENLESIGPLSLVLDDDGTPFPLELSPWVEGTPPRS